MAFEQLDTLGNRPRCAVQKSAIPTRLDERTKKDQRDIGRLEAWRRKVYAFAKHRCLCCGVAVVRTTKLVANRATPHHLEPRANKVTRYDDRNGCCVCLQCHQRITRHEIRIVGTRWFVGEDGRAYIDGTALLEFKAA